MTEAQLKILIRFAAGFMALLSLAIVIIAFSELAFDGTLVGISMRQVGIVIGLIGMLSGGVGFSLLMFFLTNSERLSRVQQEMVGNFLDETLKAKLK